MLIFFVTPVGARFRSPDDVRRSGTHTSKMPNRQWWTRKLFGFPSDNDRPWYVQVRNLPGSIVIVVLSTALVWNRLARLATGHDSFFGGLAGLIVWTVLVLCMWASAVASAWWHFRQRQARLRREAAQDAEAAVTDPDRWLPRI